MAKEESVLKEAYVNLLRFVHPHAQTTEVYPQKQDEKHVPEIRPQEEAGQDSYSAASHRHLKCINNT